MIYATEPPASGVPPGLFDWLNSFTEKSPFTVFLGTLVIAVFVVTFIWVVMHGITAAGSRQPPVVVVTLILGIVTIIALVAVMVRPDIEAIAVAVGTGIGGLAGALGLAFDRHKRYYSADDEREDDRHERLTKGDRSDSRDCDRESDRVADHGDLADSTDGNSGIDGAGESGRSDDGDPGLPDSRPSES